MADITQPTDYIPDNSSSSSSDSSGGLGALSGAASAPAMAASNPVGALSTLSLAQPTQLRAQLSQDDINKVKDTLMGRIRSQDQLDSAKAERKGALDDYQAAQRMPVNTMSLDRAQALGMSMNDKPWDIHSMIASGLKAATDLKAEQDKDTKDSAVAATKAGIDFGQKEEQSDDKMDEQAMQDLARIGAAQVRGSASANALKNNGYVTTRMGIYDYKTNPPTLVVPFDTIAQYQKESYKRAEQDANAQGMNFDSPAARQQYLDSRSKYYMNGFMSTHFPAGVMQSLNASAQAQQAATQGQPAAPAQNTSGDPYSAGPRTQITPAQQASLNGSQIAVLQEELKKTTDPAMQAELTREINKLQTKGTIAGVGPNNAGAAQSALVQPSATVPTNAAPAAGAVPAGVKIEQPEEKAGKVAESEATAKSRNAIAADWATQRINADADQNQIATLRNMRETGELNTGAGSSVLMKAGNILGAMGFNGQLVSKAANLSAANGILQGMVNNKLHTEHGTQTDSDEERFHRELDSINDPEQKFDFMMNMLQEQNERKSARGLMANSLQSAGQVRNTDLQSAWEKQRDSSFGPSMQTVDRHTVFRNQFIREAVKANAGKDPAAVQQWAAQQWLKLGAK